MEGAVAERIFLCSKSLWHLKKGLKEDTFSSKYTVVSLDTDQQNSGYR